MIHFSVKNTYAQAIIFNSSFHVKQNWSSLIYPLKSPVFICGSGDEWLKSPLHHPSSSFNYARYKRGAAYQIG